MPDSTPTPAPPKGELPLLKAAQEFIKTLPTAEPWFKFDDAYTWHPMAAVISAAFAESELTRSRAALLEKKWFDAEGHRHVSLPPVVGTTCSDDCQACRAKSAEKQRDFYKAWAKDLDRQKTVAEAALLEMERQRDGYKKLSDELDDDVKELMAEKEAAEQSLAQQRWIPVSERLPEPGVDVLLWLVAPTDKELEEYEKRTGFAVGHLDANWRGDIVTRPITGPNDKDVRQWPAWAIAVDDENYHEASHWRELPPPPSSLGTEKK